MYHLSEAELDRTVGDSLRDGLSHCVVAGCLGVEDAAYVDSINTYVRRALREHIATHYPTEKLRYSNILLCLPGLFAINGQVVETLFCRQVVSDCDDTESLLKELLTRDSVAASATGATSTPVSTPSH